MVVSPDVGGVVRARALAKRIDAPLAIVDKRRERAGESEVMNIIGDVRGRSCILLDDIVDSGGTLCNAADALLEQGASDVSAYVTHGVLSGGAVARIAASRLKELVFTDTIRPTEAVRVAKNIRVMSVAPLIGEAIGRISQETSVSSLFENAAVAGVYSTPAAPPHAAPETDRRAGHGPGGRPRVRRAGLDRFGAASSGGPSRASTSRSSPGGARRGGPAAGADGVAVPARGRPRCGGRCRRSGRAGGSAP